MTRYSAPQDLLFVYANSPFPPVFFYTTKELRSSISGPVTLPATAGCKPDLARGSAGDRPTQASRERRTPNLPQISQPDCPMSSQAHPRPLLPRPSFSPTTRVSTQGTRGSYESRRGGKPVVLRRSQKEDTGPAPGHLLSLGELGKEASSLASMDQAAASHGEDHPEASMISPGPHRTPSPASRVRVTPGWVTHVVRNQHHPQLSEHTTACILGPFCVPSLLPPWPSRQSKRC